MLGGAVCCEYSSKIDSNYTLTGVEVSCATQIHQLLGIMGAHIGWEKNVTWRDSPICQNYSTETYIKTYLFNRGLPSFLQPLRCINLIVIARGCQARRDLISVFTIASILALALISLLFFRVALLCRKDPVSGPGKPEDHPSPGFQIIRKPRSNQ